MVKSKRALLTAVALGVPLGFVGAVQAGAYDGDWEQKVVYHINDSEVASAALRNIRNHLDAEPKSKIVVVTHGKGIDFLLEGAEEDQTPSQVVRRLIREYIEQRLGRPWKPGETVEQTLREQR